MWVSERKLRVKDDERQGFLLKMTKRERAVFGNLESISLRREKNRKNGLCLPAREANVEAGAYLELI